ncbi:MAG TPA: PepSY domain-containing protein, partial [Gammaproteobacteria bacterium]
TLLPRLNSHRRIFWRDLHAIPGFVFSLWILVIISTGLPWSVVWGSLLDKFAISIHEEFPQEVFGNRPQSIAVPGAERLGMNAIVSIAQNAGLNQGYEIQYPWGKTGTFAVMPLRHGETATNTAYLFIDQFSGEIRKDIRWADIGTVGQAVSLGVRLHEGRLFGRANQFLNLAAVLVLIGMSITGFVMWLQRKPAGSLGAPRALPSLRIEKSIILTIIVLGVVLPLAGLYMLVFWLSERIRARRVFA